MNDVNELNKFIQNFMYELINKAPFIPDAILLNSVEVSYIQDGDEVESKTINLDEFDDVRQREIIEHTFNNFKQTFEPEKKSSSTKRI